MQTSALLTLLLWLATAQSRPSAMTGFDSALQNVKIGVIYLTSLANRMLGYVDPEETPVTIQAIQDGPVPTTESPLAVRRLDIDYDGEDTPVNVDAVQDSSKTELSPQATESPLASRLLDSDNDAEVTPADVIVQERSTTGLPDSGMGLLPPEVNYRQDPDHILTDGHDFSLRGLPINETISPDYDPYSIGLGKREAPDYEEKNENFSLRGLPINERINPYSIGLGKREAPDYEEKNENTEIRRRSIAEDDDEEDDDDFNEFKPTLVEGGPAQGRGSRSLTMLLLPLVAQHLVPLAAHVGLAALGGAANMAASLAASYFNTTAGVTTAANAADSLPQDTEIRRRSIDEDDDEEDDDDFNEFKPTLVEGGPAHVHGSRCMLPWLLPAPPVLPRVAKKLVPLAAKVGLTAGLAALRGAAKLAASAASLASASLNITVGDITAPTRLT